MVLAVNAAARGNDKARVLWLLATMACGLGFIVLHAKEWSNLITEVSAYPSSRQSRTSRLRPNSSMFPKTVPQFAATFFGLTGMHMLHVTLGVVYLGVIALRRKFIPILFALWLVAWLATPAYSPFHYGAHVLLIAALVCSPDFVLKPKIYDAADVEVRRAVLALCGPGVGCHLPLST